MQLKGRDVNFIENSKRECGPDGIRTLACTLVMAHHAFHQFPKSAFNPVNHIVSIFVAGNSGVGIFFVLSGFLLSSPFWRAWFANKQLPSLKVFAIRRFARIAPAFWICLAVSYCVSSVFFPHAEYPVLRLIVGTFFASGFSWYTMFPVEINGALWSISFEIVSYFMLALGAWALFRADKTRTFKNGMAFWGKVGCIVLAMHLAIVMIVRPGNLGTGWEYGLVGGAKTWWPYYNPVGFFLFFLIGICASGISENLRFNKFKFDKFTPDIIITLALMSMMLFLAVMKDFGSVMWSVPPLPYNFPFFPMLSALVLVFSSHSVIWHRVFSNKVFYVLSTLSYGLYLWHGFFLYLIQLCGVFSSVGNPLVQWALMIATSYSITIIVSMVSWKLIEKPIVAMSHRWTRGSLSGTGNL